MINYRLQALSYVKTVKIAFSSEEKAIIKNDYLEKGWGAYRIWKEHPTKGWDRVSVRQLIKRFELNGTMERKQGSGRPITATTKENVEKVEELICSQEEQEGTHDAPRIIATKLGVSLTSVRRMV